MIVQLVEKKGERMKIHLRKPNIKISKRSGKGLTVTLRTKLIGGFVIIIALLIAISGLSYFGFSSLKKSTESQQYSEYVRGYWYTLNIDLIKEVEAYNLYLATKNDSDLERAKQQSTSIQSTVSLLKIAETSENILVLDEIVFINQC
jgi:CHASE3 domain sensor protein